MLSQHIAAGALVCLILHGCGGGTASTSVASTQLLAVGDLAHCTGLPSDSVAFKTSALARTLLQKSLPGTAVLTLGDNVYASGTAAEFASCYADTWGRVKSATWPTPGNHDYYTANASGYFDYFGAAAGLDRKGYYSKTSSGWLIVSLNSNVDASVGSEQYKWLQSVLAGSKQNCVMAAWHHPVFTSALRGNNPEMKAIFELLANNKADLVLQGHEHQYERFAALRPDGSLDATSGVTSIVVGTGGAPINTFSTTPHTGSLVRLGIHGVMQLTLNENGASWALIDLDEKTQDSGALTCKAKS
jgi:acid phosphatase type 7